MALLDRLAIVPGQSPMVNLNFREAVHIAQLEVTRGGLKMTPRCRCYVCCVEGKWIVTGTSDQSHTMKRNLLPPISKALLMTLMTGTQIYMSLPIFFFAYTIIKKKQALSSMRLWWGVTRSRHIFLSLCKKKKNHSSLHCYQRTKKSLYLSEVKLISSMESILGWEKSQLWTYFLIYWTMVFSENRIFQILGSNDKGLNDTHVLAKFSCLWPFTLLSST